MQVEIITHCYSGPRGQYASLLTRQLSSLLEHPPTVHVMVTIVYPEDDRTTHKVVSVAMDEMLHAPTKLLFVPSPQPRPVALQRPIMRNTLAHSTVADVVWFADCDYLFGPHCLDALWRLSTEPGILFFPRTTLISRDHATGDRQLAGGKLDPADFIPKTETKAIGGIQIVPGDVARREGYCPHSKYQQPAPGDCETIIGFGADREFRRQLGTPGTPIELPNLFRLRHSVTGDNRAIAAGIPQPSA